MSQEKMPTAVEQYKPEHLSPEISPIRVFPITREKIESNQLSDLEKDFLLRIRSSGVNVDYRLSAGANPKLHDELEIRGHDCFVVSRISTKDKFSEDYANCVGIVAVGIERATGENISFLSHQYPRGVASSTEATIDFKGVISNRLTQLHDQCEPDSIDIVVIGGNYIETHPLREFDYRTEHEAAVSMVSEVTQDVLGIDPTISIGPKLNAHSMTDVYFENESRRLMIIQSIDRGNDQRSFPASRVSDEANKWKTYTGSPEGLTDALDEFINSLSGLSTELSAHDKHRLEINARGKFSSIASIFKSRYGIEYEDKTFQWRTELGKVSEGELVTDLKKNLAELAHIDVNYLKDTDRIADIATLLENIHRLITLLIEINWPDVKDY